MKAVLWTIGAAAAYAFVAGLAWDRHRSRARSYWRTLG